MKIKNIAIIAHVDHGKTTLVDQLLKFTLSEHEKKSVAERAMDSNDIEKERGITILAKCTSVKWKDYKINIVDTPGHADFGGEVERILGMVEGVVLLVDAREGAMPQTRFVTNKALSLGLKPIVVINKMDREDRRPDEVYDEILELFMNLDANDDQLNCPFLYASGFNGWVSDKQESAGKDVAPLLDKVLEYIDDPEYSDEPFKMLITNIASDEYLGRIITGKVLSGSAKVGSSLKVLNREGEKVETSKVTKIFISSGLKREEIDSCSSGDIVNIAGFPVATISDTLCHTDVNDPVHSEPIDPPVVSMTFMVNNSPGAGQDGKHVTSRVIRDRLLKEQEGNVSISIEDGETTDAFKVSARGELQLAILIENMRREGFEFLVGRPEVIIKEIDGKRHEPFEIIQIEVDELYMGNVMEAMQQRRGFVEDIKQLKDNKQKLTFIAPTRGLIGYYSKFLTDTKGTGIMAREFHEYMPYSGDFTNRYNGVLIANTSGKTTAYSLFNLQDRGHMFVEPGVDVYNGMIIGENSKENDLEVNPVKSKQLTNMRAAGKDKAVILVPPRPITIESAIAYIQNDEVVEVTPNYIRLRKLYLDSNTRKKMK